MDSALPLKKKKKSLVRVGYFNWKRWSVKGEERSVGLMVVMVIVIDHPPKDSLEPITVRYIHSSMFAYPGFNFQF